MLIIWGNSSLVKINPTIILWEKSGLGKKSKPRVKPSKIDMNDFSKLKFSDYFKNYKEYMNIVDYKDLESLF